MNRRLFKMSYKLILLVLLSGIITLSFLFLAYSLRNEVINFIDADTIDSQFESANETIVAEIDREKASHNNNGELYRIIDDVQNQYPALSIAIYGGEEDMYITGKDNIESVSQSFFNRFYDEETYYSQAVYEAKFYDGTPYSIYMYSFQNVLYIQIYLFIIILISIILFITIIILYFRRKMKYLAQLQTEISFIETGDFTHPITHKSNDEISAMSYQLDQMRLTLQENFEKEKEARKANADLITAMSHDLKTPLTALTGYLEIIRLKKYKGEEQFEHFLENCSEKAKQIDDLSNQMFSYFLVFGEEEQTETEMVPLLVIQDYLAECSSLLVTNGYQLREQYHENKLMIQVNLQMIKRVINNLYSNLEKYADKNSTIDISTTMVRHNFKITIRNKCSEESSLIESTKIGLTSVKRIVQLHHGTMFYLKEKDIFMVVITLPPNGPKEILEPISPKQKSIRKRK